MAEIIEYILKTALGSSVFRRVKISDAVDADGNDIRRVHVFYDQSAGVLDGSVMLEANVKLRKHIQDSDHVFAEISYMADEQVD